MAASIDGYIAAAPAEKDHARIASGFVTAADQQHVRAEVSRSDAIILGADTVRASPRLLSYQNDCGRCPVWVVLTTRGIEQASPFWKLRHIERWLVSPTELEISDPTNVRAFVCPRQDAATFVVAQLQQHNFNRVILFGGGEINHLFYRQQLVAELSITIAPTIVARDGAPCLVKPSLPAAVHLQLLTVRRVDDHLFLRYRVRR